MSDEQQLAALAAQQPSSLQVHLGVKCHKCGMMPIQGIRYRCSVCFDFDYCQRCEELYFDKHPKKHYFLKIRDPLLVQRTTVLPQLIGGGGPIEAFFDPDEEEEEDNK